MNYPLDCHYFVVSLVYGGLGGRDTIYAAVNDQSLLLSSNVPGLLMSSNARPLIMPPNAWPFLPLLSEMHSTPDQSSRSKAIASEENTNH